MPGPPPLVLPTPRSAGPQLATPSHRLPCVRGSVPKARSSVKDGLWGATVGGGLGGAPSTSQKPVHPPPRPLPPGLGACVSITGSGFPWLARPLPHEDQKPPRGNLLLTTASLPPADAQPRRQPATSRRSGSAAGPVQADGAAWICICKTKQRDILVFLTQTSERKALR